MAPPEVPRIKSGTIPQSVNMCSFISPHRKDVVACIRTKVVTQMPELDEGRPLAPPVTTTPSTSSFVSPVKSYREIGACLLRSFWCINNISANMMPYNSPCNVLNSQLRFVFGTFIYKQTLFHLLEVGLNIFPYFRECLTASKRAKYLLPKANKKQSLQWNASIKAST